MCLNSIPNYSTNISPLRILFQKEVLFSGIYAINSISKFQNVDGKSVCIVTLWSEERVHDDSSTGLGSVIIFEGKSIAYVSRALIKTQQIYCLIEKEVLPICFGSYSFHQYIFDRSVLLIESGHKTLECLFTKLKTLHHYDTQNVVKSAMLWSKCYRHTW